MREPYSFWFHPHVSILDMMVQIFVMLLGPLYVLPRYSATKDTKERMARMKSLRYAYCCNNQVTARPHILEWSKSMGDGCEIVQYTLVIPRQHDILQQWDIVSQEEKEEVLQNDDDDDGNTTTAPQMPSNIEVLLQFPSSLLEDKTILGSTKNKNGTVPLQGEFDAAKFLVDNKIVPLFVFIHGGGLVVCANDDPLASQFTALPVKQVGGKPLIMASIDYNLAPEFVFPTAIEDCLVVVDYFSKLMSSAHKNQTNQIPLHIAGVSAGGLLATIVTLESQRRNPGLIKSALVAIPMLDPAADSISYYLNSKSSWMAPVGFLRWCWQAYLQLPEQEQGKIGTDKTASLDERLIANSNRHAWAASKWRGTVYERLIKPMVDLPKGLNDDNVAPNVLVITNEADPLRDEGIALVGALQVEGMTPAKLKHLHTKGSHGLGLFLDKKAMSDMTSWLVECLFPSSNTT